MVSIQYTSCFCCWWWICSLVYKSRIPISVVLVPFRCIILPLAITPLANAKINSATVTTSKIINSLTATIINTPTKNKKISSPSSRDSIVKKPNGKRKKKRQRTSKTNEKNNVESLLSSSVTPHFGSFDQKLSRKNSTTKNPKDSAPRKSFIPATASTSTRVTGYGSMHHKSIGTLPSMINETTARRSNCEPVVYIGFTKSNHTKGKMHKDFDESTTSSLIFYCPTLNSTAKIAALLNPQKIPSSYLNDKKETANRNNKQKQTPFISVVKSSPNSSVPMYPVKGFFGFYYIPSGIVTVWIVQSEVIYDAPTTKQMQKQNRRDDETFVPTTSWYTIRKVTHLHLVHIPYVTVIHNDITIDNEQNEKDTNTSVGKGFNSLPSFNKMYPSYGTAEERRQLGLLRQALKAHEWYYCTTGGNDPMSSSFTIPDMTRNIQQSMILLQQRAANALQLLSLLNQTSTSISANESSRNSNVLGNSKEQNKTHTLNYNQSSIWAWVNDCNRYIRDTIRTVNPNKDIIANCNDSDTSSSSSNQHDKQNSQRLYAPWWEAFDRKSSNEPQDYENECNEKRNGMIVNGLIGNASNTKTTIEQERLRLLSIQQSLVRPDSRFFWNEELIEPLVQKLKEEETQDKRNNNQNDDGTFARTDDQKSNDNTCAIRTLLQHSIPVTSAYVGVQRNLSTVERTRTGFSSSTGSSRSSSHIPTTNKNHFAEPYLYDQVIISRRSRFRAGTRFTKRGADSTGNVANYAETEQLLFVWKLEKNDSSRLFSHHPTIQRNSTTNPPTTSNKNRAPVAKNNNANVQCNNHDCCRTLLSVCSYVQTRGSIPLRWSSPTDIKTYRPRVRIGIDPIGQANALQLHLIDQIQRYCIPFTTTTTTVKKKKKKKMMNDRTISSPLVTASVAAAAAANGDDCTSSSLRQVPTLPLQTKQNNNNSKKHDHPLLMIVNLVDKKSDQGRLGRAFDAVLTAVLDVYEQQANVTATTGAEDGMGTANNPSSNDGTTAPVDSVPKYMTKKNIQHVWFDFHAEVKSGRWDRLVTLLEQMKPTLHGHGYFKAVPEEDLSSNRHNSIFIPFHFDKVQKGIVRTNCMDCLDRTNVVQSLFGRFVLFQQLADLRLNGSTSSSGGGGGSDDDCYNKNNLRRKKLIPQSYKVSFRHQPMLLPWSTGEDAHRLVWADNADLISKLYAGTPALKGDFTRTGRRTKKGAIDDGMNSLQRYYLNNFVDADRQEGIDLLIGYERFRNTIMIEDSDHHQQQQQEELNNGIKQSTNGSTMIRNDDDDDIGEGISVHEAARYALLDLAKTKKTNTRRYSRSRRDETPTAYARIKQSKYSLKDATTSASLSLELRWLPGDLQNQFRTSTLSSQIRQRRQRRNKTTTGATFHSSLENNNNNNNNNNLHQIDDDDNIDHLFVSDAIEAIDRRSKSDIPWWVISDDHDDITTSLSLSDSYDDDDGDDMQENDSNDKESNNGNNNHQDTAITTPPYGNHDVTMVSEPIIEGGRTTTTTTTSSSNNNNNNNAAYILGAVLAGIQAPSGIATIVVFLIAIVLSAEIVSTTFVLILPTILRFLNS